MIRYGGLLLTHNEVCESISAASAYTVAHTDKAEGVNTLLPIWTAVDINSVKTARELWEDLATEGWKLEVSVAGSLPKLQLMSSQYHR